MAGSHTMMPVALWFFSFFGVWASWENGDARGKQEAKSLVNDYVGLRGPGHLPVLLAILIPSSLCAVKWNASSTNILLLKSLFVRHMQHETGPCESVEFRLGAVLAYAATVMRGSDFRRPNLPFMPVGK